MIPHFTIRPATASEKEPLYMTYYDDGYFPLIAAKFVTVGQVVWC